MSLSTFEKTKIDQLYENIDNLARYQFCKRLTQVKVKVILDLAQYNEQGQHAGCLVFMIRDVRAQVHKLLAAISLLRQQLDAQTEQTDCNRIQDAVGSLEQVCLKQLVPQPAYLSHSGNKVLGSGNTIIDILMGNSAYKLKYETDQLLPNQLLPLETLKKRLVVALLLLALTDPQNLGFSLEPGLPTDQQKAILDLTRQSFVWVHQKLVSVLEPYEVIVNTNIDEWLDQSSASPATYKPATLVIAQPKMDIIMEVDEQDDEGVKQSRAYSPNPQPRVINTSQSTRFHIPAAPSVGQLRYPEFHQTSSQPQDQTGKIVITSSSRQTHQGHN